MPRHMRNRYRFMPGEHAIWEGTVHLVYSRWMYLIGVERLFMTRCGMILKCKSHRRTSQKVTCVHCIADDVVHAPPPLHEITVTYKFTW